MDYTKLAKYVRANQFKYGATLPISWKAHSLFLKHAADRLFDLYHNASLRMLERLADQIRLNIEISGARELEGQELEDFWDGTLIDVYCLLIGYAIENLLKGNLLARHPEYFKPDSKMTQIRSHDLPSLCKQCQIPLNQDETILLETLRRYIEWQGKYPISLESDKMFPLQKNDGAWEERGWSPPKSNEFHEQIEQLYNKLFDEFDHAAGANPASLE